MWGLGRKLGNTLGQLTVRHQNTSIAEYTVQQPADLQHISHCGNLPSVLWRCWLGGRKGIRPVKTEWWDVGVVICLERVADLHMAQLMPLPLTVYCLSKIQIGFTFLVPAHPGSPEQRAIKWMYVVTAAMANKGGARTKNFFYANSIFLPPFTTPTITT